MAVTVAMRMAVTVGVRVPVSVGVASMLAMAGMPVGMRLVAQVATIAWLVGCCGWAVQVLWRL